MSGAFAQPESPETRGRSDFAPTQWSLIARAVAGSADSAAALERLCHAYLPAVFAYVRRSGHGVADAEDLTQEFFHRLLRSDSLAAVTPLKGRFRSWLIGALKHFLHSEWRRGMAQKRGAGEMPVSLDELRSAGRPNWEPRDDETPETAYERQWAETLVARVSDRMRREYRLADQVERYEVLKRYLPHGGRVPSYADAAESLGLQEAALKSAVFKIRRRFGQLLRHEVAQTLADPAEVEDEMRELLRILIG